MIIVRRFFLFSILLISGVIAVGYYHTVHKPLPNYEATLRFDEIEEPVTILWSDEGVPWIEAAGESDLYFAVGYVHAQERLWQMTLFQWMMEGRFAEFLGPDMVDADVYQRTLGFWDTAQKIAAATSPAMMKHLQSYADGVNRYAAEYGRAMPPEFALLKVKPIPWTPVHSIAMTRLMAWDQNLQLRSELAFAGLREQLGDSLLNALMPVYPEHAPVSVDYSSSTAFSGTDAHPSDRGIGSDAPVSAELLTAMDAVLDTDRTFRAWTGRSGSVHGSNVWAVSGSRTVSGRPMLAGDPHMTLSSPGFWFEVSLNTPDFQVSGATIPGAPFVILGSNPYVAWSITNSMADDTDLFLERFHPEDPGKVLVRASGDVQDAESTRSQIPSEGVWEDVEIRYEVIRVKGGDDLLVPVRSTRHGPVITDMGLGRFLVSEPGTDMRGESMGVDADMRGESMGVDATGDGAPEASDMSGWQPGQTRYETGIAVQWSGHKVSHELQSMYELQFATSVEEVRTALASFGSPVMTFGVADHLDTIALITAGNVPVRDGDPTRIRPGWVSQLDWKGMVPKAALPFVMNPPGGIVATANNKLHGEDYPYYIGSFWAPPYRVQRIREVLLGEAERKGLGDGEGKAIRGDGEGKSEFDGYSEGDGKAIRGDGEQGRPDVNINPKKRTARKLLTPEDMMSLQMDRTSVHARELLPLLLPVIRERADSSDALVVSYLENWNFDYSGGSTAASMFERLIWELSGGLLLQWMDEEAYKRLSELPQHPVMMVRRILVEQMAGDSVLVVGSGGAGDSVLVVGSGGTGIAGAGLEQLVFEAFERSVSWLEENFGPNPADWQWKNVHKVSFRPPLFAEAARSEEVPGVFRLIVNTLLTKGPFEAAGNGLTVNNTEYDWNEPFDVTVGASIRRVVDFGVLRDDEGVDRSSTRNRMPVTYSVLPTGQSGNPFSAYFGNQSVRWLAGEYKEVISDPVRLRAQGAREMRLVPGSGD